MTTALDYLATVTSIQDDISTVSVASDRLGDVLFAAEEALEVPGELEDILNDGADTLNFPSAVVSALGLLPFGIGTAIKTIDNIAEETADTIEAQADAMGALDDAWGPARTGVDVADAANTALGTGASAAGFANGQLQDEAILLVASLGDQEIAEGFELAARMAGYTATAQTWFNVRDDLLAPIDATTAAIESAVAELSRILPDARFLEDAVDELQGIFDPIVDVAEDLEDALCVEINTFIPFVGVIDICEILEDINDQIGAVVSFVEGFVDDVLDSLGINLSGITDDLEDLLLGPLAPVFDALDALEAQAAAAISGLLDVLDPVVDQAGDLLAALETATTLVSLFENTIQGNDLFGFEDDMLIGTLQEDAIYGKEGDDIIEGSGGGDFLFGGAGSDMLISGGGDEMYGGAGRDRLAGSELADRMDGGDGADVLLGGADADILVGGEGLDVLISGAGFDDLRGGDGDDLLAGLKGDDLLSGGAGDDVMYGGAGRDSFVFEAGADRIADFTAGFDVVFIDGAAVGVGSAEDVLALGQITEAGAVFDFGDAGVLTLTGITELGVLADDLALL